MLTYADTTPDPHFLSHRIHDSPSLRHGLACGILEEEEVEKKKKKGREAVHNSSSSSSGEVFFWWQAEAGNHKIQRCGVKVSNSAGPTSDGAVGGSRSAALLTAAVIPQHGYFAACCF